MFVTVGNSCALASSIDSLFIVNFKAEGIRLAWTVGMENDTGFMALDRSVIGLVLYDSCTISQSHNVLD